MLGVEATASSLESGVMSGCLVLLWINDAAAVADGAPRLLNARDGDLVADGSGERRRGKVRDVRKGGGVTTRARLPSELIPVVPVLQLRFGAFSLSLSLSFSLSLSLALSRSISTFQSHTLRSTEGDAYADNRAAL